VHRRCKLETKRYLGIVVVWSMERGTNVLFFFSRICKWAQPLGLIFFTAFLYIFLNKLTMMRTHDEIKM